MSEKRTMTLKVSDVENLLRETVRNLHVLLSTAWEKDDTRFDPACGLFGEAIWESLNDFRKSDQGLEKGSVTGGINAVVEAVECMYGRVLTLVEVFIPEGQQCDAVKSEAGKIVWNFFHRLDEVDLERREKE